MADAPKPPETIEVSEPTVACDGGGGALGHPNVYHSLEVNVEVECPFCYWRFVVLPGGAAGGGH